MELAAEALDGRGMVCDFNDVRDLVKGFIDREIDHRMLLREDDPLAAALASVGEGAYLMKENPTAENIAKLIFREAKARGLPVTAVRLWETPASSAEYREGTDGR